MEQLPVIIIIILGILVLAVLVCFYILYRNNKVCDFRIKINRLDSKYCQKIIDEGGDYTGHKIYNSMVNYSAMLYNIKKLTLENYLSKEDIDKLNSVT